MEWSVPISWQPSVLQLPNKYGLPIFVVSTCFITGTGYDFTNWKDLLVIGQSLVFVFSCVYEFCRQCWSEWCLYLKKHFFSLFVATQQWYSEKVIGSSVLKLFYRTHGRVSIKLQQNRTFLRKGFLVIVNCHCCQMFCTMPFLYCVNCLTAVAEVRIGLC